MIGLISRDGDTNTAYRSIDQIMEDTNTQRHYLELVGSPSTTEPISIRSSITEPDQTSIVSYQRRLNKQDINGQLT